MDAKITKQRLSRLLSYDWLKILGIIAGGIVIWSLIFTMTATRITPSQQFTVFNHYANVALDYGDFHDEYNAAIEKGVFSYEILETEVVDLSTAGDNVYTMCDTRFATSQGDMMFVPNIADAELTELENSVTYVESFFARYQSVVMDWDKYMTSARAYLNTYYNEDYKNAEMDEAKVERDFRARVKTNKDKRFKREAQIAEGVEDEIERLQKYRDGVLQIEEYLANGTVSFVEVTYKDLGTGETVKKEDGNAMLQGNYALNICPDESKASGLKDTVYYSKQTEDGTSKASAQDMCVMLFTLPDMDMSFQYETLLYINTVIASSLSAAA